MFALEIISVYLEHLSSSHASSFLHVFQWLKHGQEHLVSILPPWMHRSISHIPKKRYNHLFFWRGSKCICISPPARTVPHCLEWLEGKQIGVFQLSRMLNAERRCMNWRKISCKLWCYVERISWKQGHRSEEIGTQHWALWAIFQACAVERLTADPAQDSVPVLC